MAHEVGHALGLSGLSPFPFEVVTERGRYVMAHPTIPDSVMNYDARVRRDLAEPDCSPYPFDVMIIYALYQTVD